MRLPAPPDREGIVNSGYRLVRYAPGGKPIYKRIKNISTNPAMEKDQCLPESLLTFEMGKPIGNGIEHIGKLTGEIEESSKGMPVEEECATLPNTHSNGQTEMAREADPSIHKPRPSHVGDVISNQPSISLGKLRSHVSSSVRECGPNDYKPNGPCTCLWHPRFLKKNQVFPFIFILLGISSYGLGLIHEKYIGPVEVSGMVIPSHYLSNPLFIGVTAGKVSQYACSQAHQRLVTLVQDSFALTTHYRNVLFHKLHSTAQESIRKVMQEIRDEVSEMIREIPANLTKAKLDRLGMKYSFSLSHLNVSLSDFTDTTNSLWHYVQDKLIMMESDLLPPAHGKASTVFLMGKCKKKYPKVFSSIIEDLRFLETSETDRTTLLALGLSLSSDTAYTELRGACLGESPPQGLRHWEGWELDRLLTVVTTRVRGVDCSQFSGFRPP